MRLVIAKRVVDEDTHKISAEGGVGSFTLLPNHIDYVTALRPGIVIYDGRVSSLQRVTRSFTAAAYNLVRWRTLAARPA